MRCVSITHMPKQRLLGRRRLGTGQAEAQAFFHTRRAFREDFCEFFFILRDGMLFPLFTVHHKEAL
jgi:hypothetical protein